MTALLEAPAPPAAPERAAPLLRTLLLVVALASAAVALLVTSALSYAPSAVRIPPVAPGFTGTAPLVTLPTYGLQGMHVIGYEHGASAVLTLPVHNAGVLPMTVTSVDLGGGVAPLLEVAEVVGLPLSVPPGATRILEVRATLAKTAHVALDDQGHALRREGPEKPVVAGDPPEDQTGGDRGGGEPGPPGADGAGCGVGAVDDLDPAALALLVGLRPVEVDQEALGDLLDVSDGDAGQLTAAEPAGEAEGEQEPVAVPG